VAMRAKSTRVAPPFCSAQKSGIPLKFGAKTSAEIKMQKAEGIYWSLHFPSRYLEFCMNVCRRPIRRYRLRLP